METQQTEESGHIRTWLWQLLWTALAL